MCSGTAARTWGPGGRAGILARDSCYNPRAVADLALLLLTLLWGSTFLLVKNLLAGTSAGLFLVIRFAIAAAVLLGVALWRRERFDRALVRHGLLLGLAMFAGFALQTLGLLYTTPARSGFITGLSALGTPFLARFVLGRRVPAAVWLGASVAMVGLLALTRPFGAGTPAVLFGDLLTLGCALAYAFQIVYTGEWAPRHALAALVTVQLSVTVVLSPLLLPLEPWRFRPDGAFWGTVAFTSLVMTALAFFVMAWAQRHTTAVRTALIFALEPVSAALFSHVFGGEPLGVLDLTGGGLIILGVLVGELGSALRKAAGASEARRAA